MSLQTKIYNWYQNKGSYYLKYSLLFPQFGCRYYPTCSQYTYDAIKKYGVVKGLIKGMMRVARCNVFFKGGEDYP